MKLIVWLGNPWNEYSTTRHNAGFLLIDSFAGWEKLKRSKNKDRNAEVAKWNVKWDDILLCKPLTFMNNSWESVGKAAKFYKIKPEDILVLHDEIDLPHAQIQLKVWGGHAGHNGLKSMIAHLGTNTFSRIRIGVGHPWHKDQVSDHVLHNFTKTEWKQIQEKEPQIFDMIYDFIAQ